MDDEATFVDVIVLLALVVLVFLMAWVIKITGEFHDSKINSICKKPPSVTFKQGSIVQKLPFGLGAAPPQDLTVDFKLNC